MKIYHYKDMIIENKPYGSEPRWFIKNKDGTQNKRFSYPLKTLKSAKNLIDYLV